MICSLAQCMTCRNLNLSIWAHHHLVLELPSTTWAYRFLNLASFKSKKEEKEQNNFSRLHLIRLVLPFFLGSFQVHTVYIDSFFCGLICLCVEKARKRRGITGDRQREEIELSSLFLEREESKLIARERPSLLVIHVHVQAASYTAGALWLMIVIVSLFALKTYFSLSLIPTNSWPSWESNALASLIASGQYASLYGLMNAVQFAHVRTRSKNTLL